MIFRKFLLYSVFFVFIITGPTFAVTDLTFFLRLDGGNISTRRYQNIDKAIFGIFKNDVAKFPNVKVTEKDIMDEDIDASIFLRIEEEAGNFSVIIQINHNNLRSTATLKKTSSDFYEVQTELLEVLIEVLKLNLTKEQFGNIVSVSTKSLAALIYYGNALEMIQQGESLELLSVLSDGVKADGGFEYLLSLYNNVFKSLESFYSDSIKFSRLNKDNYMKLVDLYIINSDYIKALEIIQQSQQIFGITRDLQIKEGELYFGAKSYDRAKAIYETILRREERNIEILYRLGMCNMYLQDHGSAIDMFTRALNIQPRNEKVLFRLSEVYQKIGDYGNAIARLRELRRITGDRVDVLYRIAFVYFLDKDYDRSLNILSVIVDREQDNSESLELIGDIYFAKNDLSNAIRYFNKVISIDPENLDVYDKLAEVYRKTNDPLLNQTYITIGRLYTRRNNFEKAMEYYLLAYNIDRNDPHYYHEMGNLYFSLIDYENAIDYYQRAESLGFRGAIMFKNMAFIYILQNRLKRAMDVTYEALDLEPGNAEFMFTLGKLYYYDGNFSKAMSILKSIEQFMADSGEYHYLMGILHLYEHNFKQGMEYFDKTFVLKRDMGIDGPHVNTYRQILDFLYQIPIERGDEVSLLIAVPEGFFRGIFLDIRGKKFDTKFLRDFIKHIVDRNVRLKSMDNTLLYVENQQIDIFDPSFLNMKSMERFLAGLNSDGLIHIDLRKSPQDINKTSGHGVILANILFYRRGMEAPQRDTIQIHVHYQKSIVLKYAGFIFFLCIMAAGTGYFYIKYKNIKRGYGALRVKIIYPANRRIPMNVRLMPTKRFATLEMGEALFTRLVVGRYIALFKGLLTRYDEIMDEQRSIGEFRMKEEVEINKNEISELTLDFSKELYIEVYITKNNQYMDGAEVTIRELGITKFTGEGGYVSFVVPKMTFTFLVTYKEINIEKRIKVEDDHTTIFIEIDPMIKPVEVYKKPSDKIDFEYLE